MLKKSALQVPNPFHLYILLLSHWRKKLQENIVENGEIAQNEQFHLFSHNVFYAICFLKSFNNHISVVVCSFFEFGTFSKWSIWEWFKSVCVWFANVRKHCKKHRYTYYQHFLLCSQNIFISVVQPRDCVVNAYFFVNTNIYLLKNPRDDFVNCRGKDIFISNNEECEQKKKTFKHLFCHL